MYDRQLWRGKSGNAGEIATLVPAITSGLPRPTLDSLFSYLGNAWRRDFDLNDVLVALAENDRDLEAWLEEAAQRLTEALISICAIFDPEAIIVAGRMPFEIRKAIADRLGLHGVTFVGVSAPPPEVIVDPGSDCLELGAAALPVNRFFARHSDRLNSI